LLVNDNRADALSLVHQIEGCIDFFQGHGVGDQVVDVDLPIHEPVHDLGYVGSSSCATEGTAAPYPAGNQLERAGGNFLTGASDTNDDGLTPTLVSRLQCLAHGLHVADALEGVVGATVGNVHNGFYHVVHFLGVDEVGHTELPRQL